MLSSQIGLEEPVSLQQIYRHISALKAEMFHNKEPVCLDEFCSPQVYPGAEPFYYVTAINSSEC